MDVRYGQAVHINEGLANEEQKRNEVVEVDDDNERFICDLPLQDEAAAQDAYDTLSAESVWYHALEAQGEMDSGSYINLHQCFHEETPNQPCINIETKRK